MQGEIHFYNLKHLVGDDHLLSKRTDLVGGIFS
jgi:hypothetical protein